MKKKHKQRKTYKSLTVQERQHWSMKLEFPQCQICGSVFSSTVRKHIDHCHETDIVRGVLCHLCNVGLGYFKDNMNLLKAAIDYLRPWKDQYLDEDGEYKSFRREVLNNYLSPFTALPIEEL